jgi:hypothetical protein
MDSRVFDNLSRKAAEATTRRGVFGLLSSVAVAAGLSQLETGDALAAKKKKRCKRRNQTCGGKAKCCPGKGLVCKGGRCQCKAGLVPAGGKCVPPPVAECNGNGDCAGGEICLNGNCVPPPAECNQDADCGSNEACVNGNCICPSVLADRCVVRCQSQSDCPDGFNACRGIFPGAGQPRVVCVDEPFLLCDADPCNSTADCGEDEICAFTTCGSGEGSGRCFSILPDLD